MKIFADRAIRTFFLAEAGALFAFALISQCMARVIYGRISLWLLFLWLLLAGGILGISVWYFRRQNAVMEAAVSQVSAYLDGNLSARIDCDEEGEMYRLFHTVNTLAAVLNTHVSSELHEKKFLKNTISDISHQLKTPLAALNIYNGLIQDEAEELPEIRELAGLSEQELDRMETLVQNLLKIAKLNAGAIVLEKNTEDLADMMSDLKMHFSYRAAREQKELIFSGPEEVPFSCDRVWLMEAVDNIVKNALDHTKAGDTVKIEWKQFASMVQIFIKDNGCGIHPEDLHHIFKRFYRSRFSKDTQGLGLGLPLAKAIIEAHGGTIEVSSEPGMGTVFVLNFLITTKL